MSDRLKIRVWDKYFNRYWTDEEVKNNIQWLLYPDNENIENVIIEQCTGLKDKNGKLIYEGDIVEVTNLTKTYLLKTPVIWEADIGAFMVWGNKEKTYGNYIGALMEKDDDGVIPYIVKIIGNIHENPEFSNADKA